MKAYSYIRFSTPEQLKGDSLRRQLEASERYCKEHGLILDNTVSLQDLGLSAYHGAHRTKGALGMFIQLIESGKIERGSVLIIENLDRLSREVSSEALSLFLTIINAEIKIVLLNSSREREREITKASFDEDPYDTHSIIGEIRRAHEESKRKSFLVGSAWANKRKLAQEAGVMMTKRIPFWLKLNEERKCEVLPKAAQTIELIYKLKLQGLGKERITSELNGRTDIWFPPKTGRNPLGIWNFFYVGKILSTPAVIGEYQPMKRLGRNKREPDGEPIKNYYPPVIDETLYYQVQQMVEERAKRKGKTGGRTGIARNVFTGVAVCGICKAPLYILSWRDGHFLFCKNRYKFRNCDARKVLYSEAEELIFANLEELNVSDLLPESNELQVRLTEIGNTITAKKYELQQLEKGIENITDTIFKTESDKVRQTLEKRLNNAIQQQDEISQAIEDLEKSEADTRLEAGELTKTLDSAREIYDLLKSAKSEPEKTNIRLRIRTEIRKLIKSIEIYPVKGKYQSETMIEPGIYQTMESTWIERIRIRFNGSRNMRILYLKRITVKQ